MTSQAMPANGQSELTEHGAMHAAVASHVFTSGSQAPT